MWIRNPLKLSRNKYNWFRSKKKKFLFILFIKVELIHIHVHDYFFGLFSVSHTFTNVCTYIIRSVREEPSMVVLPRAPPSGEVPRSRSNTWVCYNWRRSKGSSTTGSQKVGLCVTVHCKQWWVSVKMKNT